MCQARTGRFALTRFGGDTCALPLDQDINQGLVEVVRLRGDIGAHIILVIAPTGRDILGEEIKEGVVDDALPDPFFIIEDDFLYDEPRQTFGPLLRNLLLAPWPPPLDLSRVKLPQQRITWRDYDLFTLGASACYSLRRIRARYLWSKSAS